MRPLRTNEDKQTAEQWLKDYLTPRELPASEIIEAGIEEGFSLATLKRAKARIGAGSAQRDRVWYWYITVGTAQPRSAKPQQRPTVDEYGYSTVVPRVTKTVNWMDVLAHIKYLRKSGLDHTAIINQIMEMAYPNSGMTEAAIMHTLRMNEIDVPNKILDTDLKS